ncbi:MAG: hypothetical protein N2117_12815 [Anaerolineales bacterium]|nr:hypothetical protein [Anaerolineales bacterium]
MSKKVKALMVVSAMMAFLPGSSRAAGTAGPNYCFPFYNPDYCWSSMQIIENMLARALADFGIGILKGISIVVWIVDRASAFIFHQTVSENGWLLSLKDQMLALLTAMMPNLLREVAFGGSGLMYVALAISGLMLMLPMIGLGARLARPERVILWGVLLSVLFVSGSFGYDFISAFESFRQNMVNRIAQGSGVMPLDKLLLYPMRAGDGDLGLTEELMGLPMIFESAYYPAPQLIEVTIAEGGILGLGNANVERPEDIRERFSKALTGTFYAVISLFGAYLLVLVGLAYALLMVTALMLMLFLLAGLPLGFFEVGGQVLLGFIQRYFEVFVQSLAFAVFLRWMANGLGGAASPNSVTGSLLWLVLVILMIVVSHVFFNGAIRILINSGRTITSSIQTIGGTFTGAFGGPNLLEMPKSAAQSAIGNTLANAGGAVAGVALLAGRPEIAMAAGLVGGLGRAMATQAQSSRPNLDRYGLGGSQYERAEGEGAVSDVIPRGNAFVDDGALQKPSDAPAQPPQPPTPVGAAVPMVIPAISGTSAPGRAQKSPAPASALIPEGGVPSPGLSGPSAASARLPDGGRAPVGSTGPVLPTALPMDVTAVRTPRSVTQKVDDGAVAEATPPEHLQQSPQSPAVPAVTESPALPNPPQKQSASDDLQKAVKSARTMTNERPRTRI